MTFYLFQFFDNSTYEMTNAISFRDAIWEMSNYNGNSSEILHKALRGFEPDDIKGMVDLYNAFVSSVDDTIEHVYEINKKVL